MSLLRRIGNLFSRHRVDREIDAELRAHIELRVEDNLAAGMSAAQARRDAILRFGNPAVMRERTTAADTALLLESVCEDVSYALRQLRKSPGFAVTAILTLALGIGANTAVFSAMNSVLLRPLAYPHAERIFQLEKGVASDISYQISVPLFLKWRAENTAFEQIAAYSGLPVGFNLAEQGRPERVPGLRVSADFFRVLGIAPQFGRNFIASDDQAGAQNVAILSSSLWQRRYRSDPAVIGKSIDIDGHAYTVIGILPPGFAFLAIMPTAGGIGIWTPLQLPTASRDPSGVLQCIGRLKRDVTTQQAAAQLTMIGRQGSVDLHPVFPHDGVADLLPLQQRITGDTRPTLLLLFGAVSFVLLIACANAANLLLARMGSRAREIGVRSALGASRMRIVRQILTESLLLASIGGALGLVIAWLCNRLLVAAAPLAIARAGDVRMDWRVLVFAFAISLVTGAVFGLLPALRMLSMASADTLRDQSSRSTTAGRSHRRLSGALVVAEMALSLMLLIAAGLLIESFVRLQQLKPGFDYGHVTTFETTLPVARYGNPAALDRFIRDVVARIEAVPGVETAASASSLPTGPTLGLPFTIEGATTKPGEATGDSDYLLVSADYFRATRIPILKGRALQSGDTAQAPGAVVINQAMARRFWPNENPLGKRIVIAKNLGPDWVDMPREIVGICGDARNVTLEDAPAPTMYTTLAQASPHMISLLLDVVPLHWLVRTEDSSDAGSASLAAQLQAAVLSVDPGEPIAEIKPLRDVLSSSISRWRFNMMLVGAFACIALVLAAIGIYGVISYAVTQRTQEIGVRIALGAGRASVEWMVIRQAGVLLGLGALVGLAGVAVMGRILKGFLYGVTVYDANVLIGVTALLCVVGLLAAWRPARRAAGIDPMRALRNE